MSNSEIDISAYIDNDRFTGKLENSRGKTLNHILVKVIGGKYNNKFFTAKVKISFNTFPKYRLEYLSFTKMSESQFSNSSLPKIVLHMIVM